MTGWLSMKNRFEHVEEDGEEEDDGERRGELVGPGQSEKYRKLKKTFIKILTKVIIEC